MARASARAAVPTTVVWDCLADGWLFASWVVGTVKIRDVDATWPATGSKLKHSVGAWPLELKDETAVLSCDPGRRLVMRASAWPFGDAKADLELIADGAEATTINFYEEPMSGPGAWVHNKVLDAILRRRLEETLDRLVRLVEGHHRLATRPSA